MSTISVTDALSTRLLIDVIDTILLYNLTIFCVTQQLPEPKTGTEKWTGETLQVCY